MSPTLTPKFTILNYMYLEPNLYFWGGCNFLWPQETLVEKKIMCTPWWVRRFLQRSEWATTQPTPIHRVNLTFRNCLLYSQLTLFWLLVCLKNSHRGRLPTVMDTGSIDSRIWPTGTPPPDSQTTLKMWQSIRK